VTSSRQRFSRRRVVRNAFGVVLLGIGLVGLLVPILPGWLLIFVGLALLGIKLPFVERLKQRARETSLAKPKA
jgi:hypothetical protein